MKSTLLPLLLISILSFFFQVEASVRVMATNQTLLSQTSAFGPRIGEYGLLAHIYEPVEDTLGCQIVQGPDTRWIALVRRGRCSFHDKVKSMQNSGAIAVIVGDEDSLDWITMFSEDDTSDIKIPSIFLPRTEYRQLDAQQMQTWNSRRLLVLLDNEDKIPWSSTTTIMNCDSIIILIVCPVLLLVLGWILLRFRKQYTSALYQQQPHLEKHTTLNEIDLEICLPRHCHTISTTTPSTITTTTTTTTTMNNDNQDEIECSICLDYFDQGAEYRVLPCQHIFHIACIDPWLTGYKSSCPVCSQDSTTNMNRTSPQENQVLIKP